MSEILTVQEAVNAMTRLRSRETAERKILKAYGPSVSRYLVRCGDRILAKLGTRQLESRFDQLAIRESQGPKDLPPVIRTLVESALDSALSESFQEDFLRPSTLALALGLDSGIKRGIKDLAALGLDVTKDLFTVRSPIAIRWIAKQGGLLIRQIDETTRGIVRGLLLEGIQSGESYQTMARKIRQRFKDDGRFDTRPRGPKHLRTRAELIAVTEVGNAFEQGSYLASRELHNSTPLEKRWVIVGDERTSQGCRSNAGDDWIPFDRGFSSGHDRPLRFPGCRCTLVVRIYRKRNR